MSDLQFGIGDEKLIEDKYPNTPILTFTAKEESSKSYKIAINKKAAELLDFNDNETNRVAFSTSKSSTNEVFIMNSTNWDSKISLKVNKEGTFNNKNSFTAVKGKFNTELNKELLLQLIPTDRSYNDQPIFELKEFKGTVEPATIAAQQDEI